MNADGNSECASTRGIGLKQNMRGLWFTAPGRAEFLEETLPTYGKRQCLLRTLFSGLSNGTERNKLMGLNYHSGQWPDRIGYQHVSEVLECGEGFTRFRPGDVVFSGGFAGHVPFHVIEEATPAVVLPEGIDRVAAALLGVAAVAMHDVRLAAVKTGERVLVIGAGLIGLFAVQAAQACGAQVTVVDRHQNRLDLALSLGAANAIENRGNTAFAQLRSGPRFEACLECSGGDVLDEIVGTSWGGGLLAPSARLVLVGGRDRANLSFNAASGCCLTTFFTAHFNQADLEAVLHLVSAGRLELKPLVRDVVPIRDAPAVYDRLRDRKSSLLGTVFNWTAACDIR